MVEFTHKGYVDRGGHSYGEGKAPLMYNYGSAAAQVMESRRPAAVTASRATTAAATQSQVRVDPLMTMATETRVNTYLAAEATVAN